MPTDNCFRLNDDEDGAPIRPEAGKPGPEDPVARLEPRPSRALLQDGELLPEGEVLGGQIGLATKQCPEKKEGHLCQPHAPLPNPLP